MGKDTLPGSSCHERHFLLCSLLFRLAATLPCFFMISFRTCPPLCLVIPHHLASSDHLTTLSGDQD